MLGCLRNVRVICQGSITRLFMGCDNTCVLSFKAKDIVVEEVVLGSWVHKHLTSSNGVSKESMLCKLYHVIKFLGSMFKING